MTQYFNLNDINESVNFDAIEESNVNKFYEFFDLLQHQIPKPKKKEKPVRKTFVDYLIDNAKENIIPYFYKKKDTYYLNTSDENKGYSIVGVTPYELNELWNPMATKLISLANRNRIYDFMIGDTPVKVYSDFVQVGNRIIPKYTKASLFKDMSKKEKIRIYELCLKVKEIEIPMAA